MGVIAQSDFERDTIGQAPAPPFVTHIPTGGAVEIAADPQVDGTRGNVLKIAEGVGSTSDYSEAKLPLSRAFSKLVLVCEVYPLQGSKTFYFGFYAGGTRYDVLKLATDGTIKYKRGSDSTWVNFSTPLNYTANTDWQRLRIVIDRTAGSGELVMVTKDGADVFSGAALDLPSIPSDIDAVAFATDSTEDNLTVYVDNVMVLEKTATLAGIVRNQDKQGISGAKVYAIRSTSPTSLAAALASATCDSRGVFVMTCDAGVYVAIVAFHASLSTHGGSVAPWVFAGGN